MLQGGGGGAGGLAVGGGLGVEDFSDKGGRPGNYSCSRCETVDAAPSNAYAKHMSTHQSAQPQPSVSNRGVKKILK